MNKNLFSSQPGIPTVNEAGGAAYELSSHEALAQLVLTGTFHDTMYVLGADMLSKVIDLLPKVDNKFIAQLAVYGATEAYMKDTPVFLTAYLATKDSALFQSVFPRVVNNGKAIRNFVKLMRSGVVGRRSLGSGPRKAVKRWIENASTYDLLNAYIGNDPSLKDVMALTHPKASDEQKENLFKWLYGNTEFDVSKLPIEVQQLRDFRAGGWLIPQVPFMLLTSAISTPSQWQALATTMTWNQIRHNLNSLARNNVFKDAGTLALLENKFSDMGSARVFPYEIFTTLQNLAPNVPSSFNLMLQKHLETSLKSVPALDDAVIMVDNSQSMNSPVLGSVNGKARCCDVAGIYASALVKANPRTAVVSFNTKAQDVFLNPNDSIWTNSKVIGSLPAGTDVSAPLRYLKAAERGYSQLIMLSDYESWFHPNSTPHLAWTAYKQRYPQARMVCIDLAPRANTPFPGQGILRVGGFSDAVFKTVDSFLKGEYTSFVSKIREIVV